MSINKIKEELSKIIGKKMSFKFNGIRNQTEEFVGYIEKMYGSVFLIRLCNSRQEYRTFSYSDILIKSLQILGE